MTNHEDDFKQTVIQSLAELTTKMNILVGEKGTNGRFGIVEEKVTEHEAYIQRQKGATNASNDRRLLWGGLIIGFANVAAILYHLTH